MKALAIGTDQSVSPEGVNHAMPPGPSNMFRLLKDGVLMRALYRSPLNRSDQKATVKFYAAIIQKTGIKLGARSECVAKPFMR
jgi:hypothetical protein